MIAPYRIVRERGSMTRRQYEEVGKAGADALEVEVMAKARAMAARIGITRPVVRWARWDLDTICAFTDYPMYLTGPNAPRLETCADCLMHYPAARYDVCIEDQEDIDREREEWMGRLVASAREMGMEAFRRESGWAANVLDEVEWRMAS